MSDVKNLSDVSEARVIVIDYDFNDRLIKATSMLSMVNLVKYKVDIQFWGVS